MYCLAAANHIYQQQQQWRQICNIFALSAIHCPLLFFAPIVVPSSSFALSAFQCHSFTDWFDQHIFFRSAVDQQIFFKASCTFAFMYYFGVHSLSWLLHLLYLLSSIVYIRRRSIFAGCWLGKWSWESGWITIGKSFLSFPSASSQPNTVVGWRRLGIGLPQYLYVYEWYCGVYYSTRVFIVSSPFSNHLLLPNHSTSRHLILKS
jgi:hypothetical protein